MPGFNSCSATIGFSSPLAAFGFFLVVVMVGCGQSTSPEHEIDEREREWTAAEIGAAFDREWREWKAWNASKVDRFELWLAGVQDTEGLIDQEQERLAKPWKHKLREQFVARVSGYRSLLSRLEVEAHSAPQREQTAWFDALIQEVRRKSGE